MMLFFFCFYLLAFYKDRGVHSTHLDISVVHSGVFSCLLPICAISLKEFSKEIK